MSINDEHLWNAIINNSSIYEIVYYYHSETAQKEMKEHFFDTRIKYLPDTVTKNGGIGVELMPLLHSRVVFT